VARLAGAGLVKREVQVSCRRSGRSIFRLPSTEALAIVTASNAVCSDCGAAVADERAEELATPTPLASSMLKGGAWLANSLRAVLKGAGLPAAEVVGRETTAEGEAQLLANVSGELFLFFVRDGDFTGADARRALEAEAETRATRLVAVSTGKIQDEARARLREHARRRSRTGDGSEAVLVEGLENAAAELRRAVESVSRETLTRELFELDQSAGFNVGLMLAEAFRLKASGKGPRDLAASAAGSFTGRQQEF
jgi:DNA-binding NarL/FixJ family response regulator